MHQGEYWHKQCAKGDLFKVDEFARQILFKCKTLSQVENEKVDDIITFIFIHFRGEEFHEVSCRCERQFTCKFSDSVKKCRVFFLIVVSD